MNSDEENEPKDEEISRAEAAKILKMHVRSVDRLRAAGDLDRQPNGKFLKSQVEQLALRLVGDEDPLGEVSNERILLATIEHLTQSNKIANEHAERLLKLIEIPTQTALKSLSDMNAALMQQISAQDAAKIESWTLMGDIIMQKGERERMLNEQVARREFMSKAGANLAPMLPKLLEQMMGGNLKQATAFKGFIDSLDDEGKQSMWGLTAFVPEGAAKHLVSLLESLKIPKPPQEVPTSGESVESNESLSEESNNV